MIHFLLSFDNGSMQIVAFRREETMKKGRLKKQPEFMIAL